MKYIAYRGMSDASDVLDEIGNVIDTAQDVQRTADAIEERFNGADAGAGSTDGKVAWFPDDAPPSDAPAPDGSGGTPAGDGTTPPASGATNYTPWIIGGAVLLVIGAIVVANN